ncbi:MAG TPA: ADOP family duplicated permease [Acidobacteriota bacterium]|nr:ADOP family duplicated permease [Acidobacteriota bacterium]
MLDDLIYRLRSLFRREQVEHELDEELKFHFHCQMDEFLEAGMSRREALRQARLAFGGLDQIKEECRQARGVSALETTIRDTVYSLWGLCRTPVFSVVAVLTLALVTGALATSFNLSYGFFFRPLPVAQADEIVAVAATRRHGTERGFVSYPDYAHFRQHARTLKGLAAHYSTAPLFAVTAERAQEINGAVVSANFFPLLGIRPQLGRFFRANEDSVPGQHPVAVVGYSLWRDWFASSRDVLGRTLKLNGVEFTVIGVAPESFRGLSSSPNQVYIPTMMLRTGYRWCDAFTRDCTVLQMVGRLAEEGSLQEAQAEAASLLPAHWLEAEEGENSGVRVEYLHGLRPGPSESRLLVLLLLTAGLLLLAGCANLAGLFLTRGSARAGELSIRAWLGASRFRLVRQLVTESLLVALCGGAVGIVLSLGLTSVIRSNFYAVDAEGHPLFYDFTPDATVVSAVLTMSVLAGFVFGLLPAIRSSRIAPGEGPGRQDRSVTDRPALRTWLVSAQAAAAVALATVAAMLTSSAYAVMQGVHFDPSQVALMRLRPRLLQYPPQKAQPFLERAVARLEALPAVESVSLWGHPGGALGGPETRVWLPQWPAQRRQAISTDHGQIGPRFFQTLGIALLTGREFTSRDTPESMRVAIVNRSLADRLRIEGGVLGAPLRLDSGEYQVVGVVEDVPLQQPGESPRPKVYTPFWQNPELIDARLCVRLRGDPASMLSLLAREVNRADPEVPIAELMPMSTHLAGLFRPLRISSAFVAFTAVLSLLLSAVGLYGTLAFTVAGRGREIGIRMAVGANPRDMRAMVVSQGMKPLAAGIAAGAGVALAGIGVVRHLLVDPSSTDPTSFLAIAALLVTVTGLAACWLPAHRAASIDPALALRKP